MNERFKLDPPWPATTQAAEGMRRRPWTVAEIEAMVRAGIIDEDERFELIGGEVVPMSPKGARHEMVKIDLNAHLQRIKPDDLRIAPETTLRLDENSFVEPDFCVFPKTISPGDMRGYDVLLAIEVADTSLRYLYPYAGGNLPWYRVKGSYAMASHVSSMSMLAWRRHEHAAMQQGVIVTLLRHGEPWRPGDEGAATVAPLPRRPTP